MDLTGKDTSQATDKPNVIEFSGFTVIPMNYEGNLASISSH